MKLLIIRSRVRPPARSPGHGEIIRLTPSSDCLLPAFVPPVPIESDLYHLGPREYEEGIQPEW